MSIQYKVCRDSNPRPLEHDSPHITTRPGFPRNFRGNHHHLQKKICCEILLFFYSFLPLFYKNMLN